MMTSTDREILIAIRGEIHAMRVEQAEQGKRIMRIEQRQDRIETRLDEQDKRLERIESTQIEQAKALIAIHEEIAVQGSQIEMLSREIGFGFGGLAVLIAFTGIFIPLYISRRKDDSANQVSGQSILKDVAELFKLMHHEEDTK